MKKSKEWKEGFYTGVVVISIVWGSFFLYGSVAHADQTADSFGTGLAYALQQQILAAQQAQNQANSPTPEQPGHFDCRDNYGNLAGYSFATLSQCERYVQNTQVYSYCEWVRH